MLRLSKEQESRVRYASFVVERAKLLYVETPKAGCTSFKHTVASLYGLDYRASSATLTGEKSASFGVHDRTLLNVPNLLEFGEVSAHSILSSSEYIRLCFVRNPFLRLTSVWVDRLLCRSISPLNPLVSAIGFPKYRANILHLQTEFSQFIEYLFKREAPNFSNHHWWRMVDLLIPDALNYNCIIRIESPELLKKVENHVIQNGLIWPGVPHFNTSSIAIGAELFNSISANRVLQMYEEDFDRFNYQKVLPQFRQTPVELPDEGLIHTIQERNERIFFLSLRARGLV